MTKILVELDDNVAARLRSEAAASGVCFEDFLREAIESLPVVRHDPFRALSWDEAMIDQILEETMKARETQLGYPLNLQDWRKPPTTIENGTL